MRPRGYKHRRDSQQFSFYNIGDFSVFITPTTFIEFPFRFFSSVGIGSPIPACNHGYSPIIFSSVGGGSLPLACHNTFYFPLVNTCCFNPEAVKVRGGLASINSPRFWFNNLCRLDERGRGGESLLLFPLRNF